MRSLDSVLQRESSSNKCSTHFTGFAVLSPGDAPEINCDNPSCGKPFHRRCLVEWLNSGQGGLMVGQGGEGEL